MRTLIEAGHQVTGLTRSAHKRKLVEATGASAVIADALDLDAVATAVRQASPTRLVNLLTALPPGGATRPKDLKPTNRLRVEGSRNLLKAAALAGVRRVVAESFLAVYGFPGPCHKLTEETPLGPVDTNHPLHGTVMALRSLEQQHRDARNAGRLECVTLRFGFLYGPGVSSTTILLRNLGRGRLWLPVRMTGIGSWIHLDDAVSAILAALENDRPAEVYNITDNQPLPLRQAITIACELFGVPTPRSIPSWLLRAFAPVVASMTAAHWALDNQRAQQELCWRPAFPTLRDGFTQLARRGMRL